MVERGPRHESWSACWDWVRVEVEPGELPDTFHLHVTESGTLESRFTLTRWQAIMTVGQELLRRVAAHRHGK